jgi:hypothetical protein
VEKITQKSKISKRVLQINYLEEKKLSLQNEIHPMKSHLIRIRSFVITQMLKGYENEERLRQAL